MAAPVQDDNRTDQDSDISGLEEAFNGPAANESGSQTVQDRKQFADLIEANYRQPTAGSSRDAINNVLYGERADTPGNSADILARGGGSRAGQARAATDLGLAGGGRASAPLATARSSAASRASSATASQTSAQTLKDQEEFAAMTNDETYARDGHNPNDPGNAAPGSDQVGQGYRPDDEQNGLNRLKPKGTGFWNRRRAGAAAGGSTAVLTTMILLLGLVSGPAEFFKLSAALSHAYSKNSEDTSQRLQDIFQSAVEEVAIKHITNGAAKTKLQFVATKTFGNPVNQLKDVGVTFDKHFLFGTAMQVNFEPDKLAKAHPEFKDMTDPNEIKKTIADLVSTNKLKITPDQIIDNGNGTFSLKLKGFSLGALSALAKSIGGSTLPLLDNGKFSSWVQVRILRQYLGVSSFLHPLKRVVSAANNKVVNGTLAERDKATRQADEADFKTRAQPFETQAAPLVDEVKSKNSLYNSTVSKILLYTGLICFIRAVADTAIAINFALATHTAVEGLYENAIGNQLQANSSDISQAQLAVKKQDLTYKGHDVWSGCALQQLQTGSHYKGCIDIVADYKQAFADSQTPATIRRVAGDAIGGDFVAGLVCSPAGVAAQFIIGLAQYATDILAEVGSLGTATPAVMASIAAKIAITVGTKVAVQFVLTSLAMDFLKQIILNKTTATLAYDAFKGAGGGNLYPYGVREAASLTAMSSGGVDLGNTKSTLGLNDALKSEQQQFQSQSFYARMFDTKQDRSLIDSVAADISPSFSQNLLSGAHNFLNIGNVLLGNLSNLLPSAAADPQKSTDYDWGFGQAGLPPNMLSDPLLADALEDGGNGNAAKVADILNTECPNGDMSGPDCSALSQRVDTCFGASFTYDGTLWDVKKMHTVNPHTDAYDAATCNDVGDQSDTKADNARGQWRREIMFIFDTFDAKTAACYQGDAQSCQDIGSDVLS